MKKYFTSIFVAVVAVVAIMLNVVSVSADELVCQCVASDIELLVREDKNHVDRERSKLNQDDKKSSAEFKHEQEKYESDSEKLRLEKERGKDNGTCVCPSGIVSYYVPVGSNGTKSSIKINAFREIRGQ